MEIPAKHNKGEFHETLLPGEYRVTEKRIYFILPPEMEAGCPHPGHIHSVPIVGSHWTLNSVDPIDVSPSIWYNQGQGKERGEWHGFLRNGKFVQV